MVWGISMLEYLHSRGVWVVHVTVSQRPGVGAPYSATQFRELFIFTRAAIDLTTELRNIIYRYIIYK